MKTKNYKNNITHKNTLKNSLDFKKEGLFQKMIKVMF